MPVTGGSVEFERKVNLGDYQHKSMKGNISFIVSEGGNFQDEWNKAADFAVREVETRLGLSAKIETPIGFAVTPTRTKSDIEAEVLARATMPPAPAGRKPRKAPDAVPLPVQTKGPDLQVDPNDIPGFLRSEQPATSPSEWDQPVSSAPKEVTDKDLTDACTRKTKSGVAAAEVKNLIAQYIKTPGTLREMAQDKRGAFLAALEVLK